jgi:hypothetical protein
VADERASAREQLAVALHDPLDLNINNPPGIALYSATRKCKKRCDTDFYIPQKMV